MHSSTYFTVFVNTSLPTILDTTGISDILKTKPWPGDDIMLKIDLIPFPSAGTRKES